MTDADDARAQLAAIKTIAQQAAGDGAAADQQINLAVNLLNSMIEALGNARVHTLQHVGLLREEIVPQSTQLFQGSLSGDVSDAIQDFNIAQRKAIDFANFLQNKIDQLKREVAIISRSRHDNLSESALFFRAAIDKLDIFNNNL
jgi:hypothetical protein